jgi:Acetyltransferase (GNAT) domain
LFRYVAGVGTWATDASTAGNVFDAIDAKHWDGLVAEMGGIDPWCSTFAWQRAVDDAFGNDPERVLVGDDRQPEHVVLGDSDWAAALRGVVLENGVPALLALDAMWAFGTPIVAKRVALASATRAFSEHLANRPDWKVAFLPGVTPNSDLDIALLSALNAALGVDARLLAGEETVRCVASLQGGFHVYLQRRPREFRRNIRQAERRAENHGITIESRDPCVVPCASRTWQDDVLLQMLAVEETSWKGQIESGILSSAMITLYRSLLTRFPVDRVRFSVALIEDRVIGFVLGGIIGKTYRGLQISFDNEFRAHSIGTLLQSHEIKRLCDEGIERYDLGMDMEYKQRWAESRLTTRPILVVRN